MFVACTCFIIKKRIPTIFIAYLDCQNVIYVKLKRMKIQFTELCLPDDMIIKVYYDMDGDTLLAQLMGCELDSVERTPLLISRNNLLRVEFLCDVMTLGTVVYFAAEFSSGMLHLG